MGFGPRRNSTQSFSLQRMRSLPPYDLRARDKVQKLDNMRRRASIRALVPAWLGQAQEGRCNATSALRTLENNDCEFGEAGYWKLGQHANQRNASAAWLSAAAACL